MSRILYLGIFLLTLSADVDCALSSIFTPCKASDAKINDCLKQNAQKMVPLLSAGIAELDLPSFDPFTCKDYESDENADMYNKFEDAKIYGFKGAKIESVKLNQKRKKVSLNLSFTSEVDLKYTYKTGLVNTPITGEAHFTFNDVSYKFKIYFTTMKGSDGKDRWRVQKHKVTYYPGKIVHKFKGLVNNNAEFTKWLTEFSNDNYKEVHTQFEVPLLSRITEAMVDHIDKFFEAVPADALFKS